MIVIHYIKYITYVCRNRRILLSEVHVRYELEGLMTVLEKREKWRTAAATLVENLRFIYEE